jgi:hypothetical protein
LVFPNWRSPNSWRDLRPQFSALGVEIDGHKVPIRLDLE